MKDYEYIYQDQSLSEVEFNRFKALINEEEFEITLLDFQNDKYIVEETKENCPSKQALFDTLHNAITGLQEASRIIINEMLSKGHTNHILTIITRKNKLIGALQQIMISSL
jgi:hypothetical protein